MRNNTIDAAALVWLQKLVLLQGYTGTLMQYLKIRAGLD